jgi:hypothetical protein
MAEETIAEEQEQEQEETNVDEVKDQRLEEESQRQIMQFMADHGGSEEEVETPEEETSQEEDETVEAETEEVAVAEVPADETTKSLSKNFVQVAKREREIYRRQQEVKQREQGLKKYEEIEASVKRGDHLQALEKLGGSYESATDQVLGREPQGREQSELAQRVERLENEKASLEAGQKVSDYVNRLKTLADSSEEFSLTNSMWDEAQEIALETASQYAQNTGKLLGDDQLLGLVENYYSQEAEKLLQHPKFSNRKASAVAEEKPTSRPVQRSRNRTLSQKTSRSSSSKKSDTPLTQDEILERAMGAFNGSLRV